MANVNSIVTAVRQRVNTTIKNVSNWFGPLQPLAPFAPDSIAGRQRDYQIGENMVIRTRETGRPSFALLRAFAENCDILRLVIETRKDQVEALEWEIVPIDDKASLEDPRIKEVTTFFRRPDGRQRWGIWIRALLEDMFVIDAMTLYKVRDRLDRLHSLELMDGALIKVLNDGDGRVPRYPDPSYQQILHGMTAIDYTTQDILYVPRTMRTWSQYGLSVVEQILLTVETLLNRTRFNANYYVDGNLPAGLIFGDTNMTNEQLEAFNDMLDTMLSGNLKQRRKILTVPGAKGKFQEIKEPPMKDDFDEWLARIICFAFSISPQPFVKQMNRATGETAQETALSEGLQPIIQWMEGWHNDIIEQEFGYDDLKFSVKIAQDMDQKVAADIRASDVKSGIISPDEARESIGLEARGGAADELGIITGSGFTPLQMGVDALQQQNDAKVEAIKNPPIPGGIGGNKQGNTGADGAGTKTPPATAKSAGAELKKGSKKKSLYQKTHQRSSQPRQPHGER